MYVVWLWLTVASELYAELFRLLIRTLYENFPELSVDGCHFRLTVQSVMAVTVRLPGTVGAERSPLPADETVCPLKSSTAVNANVAAKMMSRENCRVDMTGLQFSISATKNSSCTRTRPARTHAGR